MENPRIITLPTLIDDRGILTPLSDELDSENIRRCYIVENHDIGTVRGLHYHFDECKYFYIAQGAAKFITAYLDPLEVRSRTPNEKDIIRAKKETFILSDKKRQLLVVPNH
jgi:dTDP-4-dehydrorhamnose 3,5-epimerase-like enzyme